MVDMIDMVDMVDMFQDLASRFHVDPDEWDVNEISMRRWCLSFSKTSQCEDLEVLSDLNKKDSTFSFRIHLNVILIIETKLPNFRD
jgi:hypothetical protein